MDLNSELALNQFTNSILKQSKLLKKYSIEEGIVRRTMQIFKELFEIRNDPTTRDSTAPRTGPKAKSNYIKSTAEKLLETYITKELATVEGIEAIDEITGSETFNVVVTLGNPSTGPVVDIMAHHDTIHASDYSLSTKEVGGGLTLLGQTIQDDTIHVAAALALLPDFQIPECGAIRVSFTDFEENGCRGSSAIHRLLLERNRSNSPYAVVALESTNGQLAFGHRGKFSGEVKHFGRLSNPTVVFRSFYRSLVSVQRKADTNSGSSLLGKTTGSSTCGYIKAGTFWAKLDFRTNSIITPKIVETMWVDALQSRQLLSKEGDLVESARRSFVQNEYSIEIQENEILVSSDTDAIHPSTFTPDNDSTVMPVIYLLLLALHSDKELNAVVSEIEWGDMTRQNSNPLVGRIVLENTVSFTKEVLLESISDQVMDGRISEVPDLRLIDSATSMSDAVESNLSTGLVHRVAEQLGITLDSEINITTVPFMTDASRIFNRAKKASSNVYGFVWGVGDPHRLHGVEQLSSEDVLLAIKGLRLLPDILHDELVAP